MVRSTNLIILKALLFLFSFETLYFVIPGQNEDEEGDENAESDGDHPG